ncbi:MAG: glycosyltransferase family 1 protein [Bacteroidales bacterium]
MRRSGLYIVFHGFAPHSGITQKIYAQLKAFSENDTDMHLCQYNVNQDGHDVIEVDQKEIYQFGSGIRSKIEKRITFSPVLKHILDHKYDFVYIRYYSNANPFFIAFVRSLRENRIKVLIEIPTYPYDNEFAEARHIDKVKHWFDKRYRNQLFANTDYVVTYSDDQFIFGCPAIQISNGIDFERIPLRVISENKKDQYDFIMVGELHYWHGVDRAINGIADYNQTNPQKKVYLHIVGQPSTPAGFMLQELVKNLRMEEYILFHGPMYGSELNDIFDRMDFAIGSLGRHRSNITQLKSLKNREYAARGIPFVYSEHDPDFDKKAYTLHAPDNESPLNIRQCIEFIQQTELTPGDIRNSIYPQLSWSNQIQKIFATIYT